MKRAAWWATFLILLGGALTAAAQHYPRFHRYARTTLDDRTSIDLIKDAATQRCYAVYLYADGQAGGAATLGEVPCNPIPVPVVLPGPASPIR